MSLEKKCGTCKWWAADSSTKLPNGKHYSDCTFFMPASIAEVKRFPMLDVEGANCPVWEKKGSLFISDNNMLISRRELLDECRELNPWRPIDENTPRDRELLLRNKYYRSVGEFNSHLNAWVDGAGLAMCPTHYCEIPKEPE